MTYRWSIGGVVAVDRMDLIPTPTIGATVTYAFVFERRPDYRDAERRHADVLERLHYASDEFLDIYQPLSGPPLYRDQSPEGHDPLVAIDAAGSGPPRVPRVWGLIVGGEDKTASSGALFAIDLEVLVLAGIGEFDDRDAVRSVLEADGPT